MGLWLLSRTANIKVMPTSRVTVSNKGDRGEVLREVPDPQQWEKRVENGSFLNREGGSVLSDLIQGQRKR